MWSRQDPTLGPLHCSKQDLKASCGEQEFMSSPRRAILPWLVLCWRNDLESHPKNDSNHWLSHYVFPNIGASLLWYQLLLCKIICLSVRKQLWKAHAFLVFLPATFHLRIFQMQNILCCQSCNGAGLNKVVFEITLLCSLKRCLYWRERREEGSGMWFFYLWLWVNQLGYVSVKKKLLKLMLIGKELPCILNDMLNEANMSTITMMNKLTLTQSNCSDHQPCFSCVSSLSRPNPLISMEWHQCFLQGMDLTIQIASRSSPLSKATLLDHLNWNAEGTASPGWAVGAQWSNLTLSASCCFADPFPTRAMGSDTPCVL